MTYIALADLLNIIIFILALIMWMDIMWGAK